MRRFVVALAAMGLAVLLSSCGGGGVDDSPGSGFRVSVDRSSLAFDYVEGTAPSPKVVLATGTGDPGGTVYVNVVIEGQGFAPSGVSVSLVGTRATFTFQPRLDLAAGTYTGRLLLMACPDPQCSRQFSGSPVAVSYTNVVHQGLRVTPGAVNLAATSGQTTSTHLNVQLPEGATSYSPVIGSGADWLSLANVEAGALTLNTRALPGGRYVGALRVGSGTFDTTVPVVLDVSYPPSGTVDLAVGAQFLNFSSPASASAPEQALLVTPPNWSPDVAASIEYLDGSDWLVATPGSAGNNTWRIGASAGVLNPGTYRAHLRFAGGYPSLPKSVSVTFVVGDGLNVPAIQTLSVDSETTAAMLSGSTPVQASGGQALHWSATSASSWLQIDKASGDNGTALTWSIKPSSVAALANFATHTATIQIVTDLPNVPSGSMTVQLAKRLPDVQAVTPYTVVAGQPTRVTISGRGFESVSSLPGRLSIAGVTPTRITRLSDSLLQVQLPALAAGPAAVQITNALGQATESKTLKSIGAQTFGYASYPAPAGLAQTALYDAERRAFFVTRSQGLGFYNSVSRLSYDGSGWVSTPLVADDIGDVGLNQDGSALLATTSSGELRWLSPTDGTDLKPRLNVGIAMRGSFLSQGLPVSPDGRLWFATGTASGGGFAELTTLNLNTGERVKPTEPTGYHSFYNGPTFAMSRNGSRLLGQQNSGISGGDELTYGVRVDPVTNVVSLTIKVRSPFDIRFTADGQHTLLNFKRVLDGNDDLFGLVQLPAVDQFDWTVVAAQITSSGSRVYLLAYPVQGNLEASSSGIKPRVYVIDSSTASADPAGLPVLGYFEIDDYPSPCSTAYSACWALLASAITPDDRTLFFAGSLRNVVVPVATTLKAAQAGGRPAAAWVLPQARQTAH